MYLTSNSYNEMIQSIHYRCFGLAPCWAPLLVVSRMSTHMTPPVIFSTSVDPSEDVVLHPQPVVLHGRHHFSVVDPQRPHCVQK